MTPPPCCHCVTREAGNRLTTLAMVKKVFTVAESAQLALLLVIRWGLQGSMLLDRLQIGEDGRDLIGLEDEFRHVGMANGEPFCQGLGQSINGIPF